MKAVKQKGQLYRSLQAISILPLLILGLIITAFSYYTVESAMHNEIHTELKNIADSVILTYDLLYPGDYYLEGGNAHDLYKGDRRLAADYSIIDRFQKDTAVEITLFYQDTRILTTIRNEDGSRIIGTSANPLITQDVLLEGQPHFYTNTTINDAEYFAYYTPLHNRDGSIAGMLYTGKPSSEVNKAIKDTIFPIVLIALCTMVTVSIISSSYTRRLIISLQKIRTFLSRVSTGNLTEVLDAEVLRRNDELSEMGYSALYMQRSIRNLVEQDTLTELNNRRFADKQLKQAQMQANIHGTSFVIAIGDIDLFKSVNDTYGHECGDLVLKQIAATLKKGMMGKGFVARWGGEEFLFLYDDMNLQSAKAEVEILLDEIRKLVICYDDQPIHITMTFGLAQGCVNTNIRGLLQEADAKLYEGKANGRNCVVI